MSLIEYESRFTELSHHAVILIPTKSEKVRRFIEGLNYGIKISIDRDAKIEPIFYHAFEITHGTECI